MVASTTSNKGKDSTSCVVVLDITEKGRSETKIIKTKIMEYLYDSSKHTIYEDKKVTLNIILSDLLVKDI